MSAHVTVLLHEAVQALAIRADGVYLDGTFGRGGHSRAMLAALGRAGRLYALDRDPQAAEAAAGIDDPRFHFARCPFSRMETAFADVGAASLDGILLDLGVSSPQLDQAARGFSFGKEGPLDMRMDNESGITAADWLAATDEATLARVIRDWGGEPHTVARRIARAVIAARGKLRTTLDLAAVVADAVPRKLHKAGFHPATQTFQAIRIAVNDELTQVEQTLQLVPALLRTGGRVGVISFHSLEARLVKRFFAEQRQAGYEAELRILTKKPIAGNHDDAYNPRARSAKLRAAAKI